MERPQTGQLMIGILTNINYFHKRKKYVVHMSEIYSNVLFQSNGSIYISFINNEHVKISRVIERKATRMIIIDENTHFIHHYICWKQFIS